MSSTSIDVTDYESSKSKSESELMSESKPELKSKSDAVIIDVTPSPSTPVSSAVAPVLEQYVRGDKFIDDYEMETGMTGLSGMTIRLFGEPERKFVQSTKSSLPGSINFIEVDDEGKPKHDDKGNPVEMTYSQI